MSDPDLLLEELTPDERIVLVDHCFRDKPNEALSTLAIGLWKDDPRIDALVVSRVLPIGCEIVHGYNPELSEALKAYRTKNPDIAGWRPVKKGMIFDVKEQHAVEPVEAIILEHCATLIRAREDQLEIVSGKRRFAPRVAAYPLLENAATIDVTTLTQMLRRSAYDIQAAKLKNVSAKIDELTIEIQADDGTIYSTEFRSLDSYAPILTTRHSRLTIKLTGKPGRHWPAYLTVDVRRYPPVITLADNPGKLLSETTAAFSIHKALLVEDPFG